MKIIGVTGGIGSGKTTVCDILRSLGCDIFNADLEAKRLQETDADVIAGIKNLFGDEIYQSGVPDRKKIASIVFSDSKKLDALNRLIHPKVFALFEAAKAQAAASGKFALVKEAAILFESGGARQVDETIAVIADKAVRIKRLLERGLSEAEAEQRIAAQLSNDDLIKRADYVICNNGTLDDLTRDTEKIFHQIFEPLLKKS